MEIKKRGRGKGKNNKEKVERRSRKWVDYKDINYKFYYVIETYNIDLKCDYDKIQEFERMEIQEIILKGMK